VSDNLDPNRDESLREVAADAQRAADDAREFRSENERAARRGQDTDYDFRLPPDMAEADRVRASDDVELADRQESMAETQRRAAEALRRNAEILEGTARELDRAGEAVRENRDDLRDIQQNTEELRAQVSQAREQVDRTDVPEVDRSEMGDGRGGKEGGNG
jgi:chromosome segregation ATPase